MAKQYVKHWSVPSKSKQDKKYKVSLTADGNYECDCPAWIFHKGPRSECPDCHHIKAVKANPELFLEEAAGVYPVIVMANVKEVTRQDNQLLTPLVPIGNVHFIATVMYDLLRHGVPWSQIKDRYGEMISENGKPVTKESLIIYINHYGRLIIEEYYRGSTKYELTREGLTLRV